MKYLNIKILSTVVLLFLFLSSYATHNRAGEITYKKISELTYEVTIITYTATGPGYTADRPELEISWGDNTSSILPRVEEVFLPDYYKRNKYVGTHTFPGPGVYELVVEDPNRNAGVSNIPNSVNVVFSISTTMNISAELGANSTPVLTQPPIDKAAVNQVFIHNPGAYDPDGDSISYKLTTCRSEDGEPIENYSLPEASDSLTVNPVSGDLVWDTPVEEGVYNIAILIEEWRDGKKIGKIIRDMQIEVFDTDNESPQVMSEKKICVEAGTFLEHEVTATDSDGDNITMSANGGPFLVEDSTYVTFYDSVINPGKTKGFFEWQTICEHVRMQPYLVNFKASDNASPVTLVDIENVNIYVIGPATKLAEISSTTNSITLKWRPNRCENVTGYKIYRSNKSINWSPGECTRGIPDTLDYELVGTKNARNDTVFFDNNNGNGLPQGYKYCYRIVAIFPDGVESYASKEICTELVRGIPAITNVSVENTDSLNGEIYLAWSKPTEFDTTKYPGPYKYLIYRSKGLWGENLELIDSTMSINDTIYYDSSLNTKDNSYSYRVEFYNNKEDSVILIGTPHIASSLFLRISSSDNELKLNFDKNVPWQNYEYTVYKKNLSGVFDSLAAVSKESFTDSLLKNGKEYCYKIKSTGSYNSDGFVDPIINWSQINCGIPRDTTPPCPPKLTGNSLCDSVYNNLEWTVHDSCYEDTYYYNLYYKTNLDGDFVKLDSTEDRDVLSYVHYPDTIRNIKLPEINEYKSVPVISIAACYYVTAVDSFGNESKPSNTVCLDECSYYKLPNVFTPNNDGLNDYFYPKMPYYNVAKVDMKIFNRWGQKIFETSDPDIMWDGRIQKNNNLVSDGVYFYTCDVYEYRLTGIEPRHLHGTIHVYTAGQKPNPSKQE